MRDSRGRATELPFEAAELAALQEEWSRPAGTEPVPVHEDWTGEEWARHDSRPHRRVHLYLTLHTKFALAVLVAMVWTTLSVWLARPWLHDLGELTHPVAAFVIISAIAFLPGFMYAFMLASLLLDKRPARHRFDSYPGVTMLIPAYNEEAVLADTLRDVARLHYSGPIEVLIVNDGSSDGTAQCVHETIPTLDLPPNMTMQLVDFAENQGKAAALNRVLPQARYEVLCTIDADSRPRPEALRQIVGRMLSDPPNTQAVAGEVLVGNSRETFVTRIQEWDYFHGIAAVKRIQSMYHGTLVAQGAFSIYRKAAIEAVGGWPETVGEDIALTWAMLEKGYRIGYAEDAIVWTTVPRTLGQFLRQRKRWARGMIEALEMYEGLLLKPRMTTLFIWWNLLFLPMDVIFTFVFIPGLIAALFGVYWIAGPMTLAVLPLGALSNIVIFEIQWHMFRRQGLHVRRNYVGLLFYALFYSLLMQPIGVWGYASELLRQRRSWETK
ncbi:MAG: glycosyltransferase family 2 protein [Novosphingobium sp.]|nr:glycosyltransferase family 2 protein [Novosphingobium sp.]